MKPTSRVRSGATLRATFIGRQLRRIGHQSPPRIVLANAGAAGGSRALCVGSVGAVCVLGMVVALVSAGGDSASAAIAAVTLTGTLTSLPAGSAVVSVSVQVPEDRNSKGVPQVMTFPTLVAETITSRSFSVTVPKSEALTEAEQSGNGVANLHVDVVSGSEQTSQFVPAPLAVSDATANAAARIPTM